MANLFVYGTLMSCDLVETLLGKSYASVPGYLTGFRRVALRGRTYPGIIRAENHEVKGKILHRVTPEDMTKLDDYEGEDYERKTVTAVTAAGEKLEVYLYIWTLAAEVLDEDWDYDAWLKSCASVGLVDMTD